MECQLLSRVTVFRNAKFADLCPAFVFRRVGKFSSLSDLEFNLQHREVPQKLSL